MAEAFKYDKVVKAKSYEDYLKQCDAKMYLVNIGEETFYTGTNVEYDIDDIGEAKNVMEKSVDDNLKILCEYLIENKGKLVEDAGGEQGCLIGLNLTHEDYYYILKKDDKVWYETCVSKLKII